MIKFNKGGLEHSEYLRVKHALDVVSSMSMPPMAGFIEDRKFYEYIDFIYTKKKCIEALDTLREFVEEFAPDVEEPYDK